MNPDPKLTTEDVEEVGPEAADVQPQAPAADAEEPIVDGEPVIEAGTPGPYDETLAFYEAESAPASAELVMKAAKADEYLALAQRTQADFENYRKRATRDAQAAQLRGVIKLAKELLPAVDDLDRALAAAVAAGEGADDTLVSGIKLVHNDVIAALARVGIEQYSPLGERFDPQIHEAMAQQPVDGAEPGTIVEVYQRGYALGDSVIRPARVVVAG
jgi:molecular chaperone GrpE